MFRSNGFGESPEGLARKLTAGVLEVRLEESRVNRAFEDRSGRPLPLAIEFISRAVRANRLALPLDQFAGSNRIVIGELSRRLQHEGTHDPARNAWPKTRQRAQPVRGRNVDGRLERVLPRRVLRKQTRNFLVCRG